MDDDRSLRELTKLVESTQRKLRHEQDVYRLMDTREDLRGISAMADLVEESVRWSA